MSVVYITVSNVLSSPFLPVISLSLYVCHQFLPQGWNSLETVIAAEGLALTLQSVGSSREAQELFER